MLSRVLSVDVPVDLRRTLRPLTLAWGRWLPDGWWRPARTPEGAVTLRVSRGPEGIRGDAWGPGADWVLERLGDWVGLWDRPDDFLPDHPVVSDLHRRSPGARFGRTALVFDALAAAIVTQKVTGKEAAAGLRGLCGRFSDPAPGPLPRLRLPPDPERLAAAPYHAFHDLGIEKRRADALRRVAADAGRLARLAATTPTEAGQHLRRYPGVGRWTVAETLAVCHGDPDAVSVGDFHHKHLVSWHLTREERGTDERMLELLEPFRPHRGRVVRLLEWAGPYPRHGARIPLRSFASY